MINKFESMKFNIFHKAIFFLTICSYIYTIWLFIDIERFYDRYDFKILDSSFDMRTTEEQTFELNVNYPSEYWLTVDCSIKNLADTFQNNVKQSEYYDSFMNDTILNFYWWIVDDNNINIESDSTQSYYDRNWKIVLKRELGRANISDTGKYILNIRSDKTVPELSEADINVIVKASDYKSNNYRYHIIIPFLISCLLTSISIFIIIYIRIKKMKSNV